MKKLLILLAMMIIVFSCTKNTCWECELTQITYSMGGVPSDTIKTNLIECNQSEPTIRLYEKVFTYSPHYVDGKLMQSNCVCKKKL